MMSQRHCQTSLIHPLFRKPLDYLLSEGGKFSDAELKVGIHNGSFIMALCVFISQDFNDFPKFGWVFCPF